MTPDTLLFVNAMLAFPADIWWRHFCGGWIEGAVLVGDQWSSISPAKNSDVPWRGTILNGNFIFQPSVFRGHVSFRVRNIDEDWWVHVAEFIRRSNCLGLSMNTKTTFVCKVTDGWCTIQCRNNLLGSERGSEKRWRLHSWWVKGLILTEHTGTKQTPRNLGLVKSLF